LGLAFWGRGTAWAATAPVRLSVPDSLLSALTDALHRHEPLVVMVSLPGCPFCHVARNNYLGPMARDQGLQVVQVDMRNPRALVDFDGQTRSQDEVTRRWGIRVAPTLLFFGPSGREVAERLEGGSLPDFYGAYLDERVRAARAALAK